MSPNVQRDPDNHLWSLRPPRRLEAEAIRDALLQMGGKLDDKMYGPSEVNYESGRRSVYLRVKRSELVPFLTMFDAPEPTPERGRSRRHNGAYASTRGDELQLRA